MTKKILNIYEFWTEKQTDRLTDIATTRLNQPRGRFSENYTCRLVANFPLNINKTHNTV